ncbi:peptide deformylase [Atribacter laminatus]|uniref:Peptide deformylase n=1 Tax=Atribacter laminatus TaxID=2847778 RepID=A0A7T1AJ77_ATRLM|nr:peptide deformylase [Atribacter laminatus]QPM66913.1 Peptide deformylase [Atribacter laminatus]
MADLNIEIYGSQVLRQKAEPVQNIDAKVKKIIQDMYDTLHEKSGLGLAANQVGILRRLVVLNNPNINEDMALINPEWKEVDTEKETGEEGCLSVPGIYSKVNRFRKIQVTAQDVQGKQLDFLADGLLARIVQHEVDHLNGILFIDRLSPTRRLVLASKLSRINSNGDNG